MVRAFFSKVLRFFKPPRKISFTKEGLIFTLFTFPVGLAAINTGNNMLYLILGMLLSVIAVSGILSETSIKKVEVSVRLPSWAMAETPLIVFAEVFNSKKRFPSYLLRIFLLWERQEEGVAGRKKKDRVTGRGSFLIKLGAGESHKIRLTSELPHRGIYRFRGVKLATRFPFGLFDKSREISDAFQVTVYPRPLKRHETFFGESGSTGDQEKNIRGWGGDLYALREYHRDDDARLIHWKVSAKVRRPILREFTETGREQTLIYLDTWIRQRSAEVLKRFEGAISHVAFLVEQALENGLEFGLQTPDIKFSPQKGEGHFHQIMTYLATVKPRILKEESDSENARATSPRDEFSEEGARILYVTAREGWARDKGMETTP